MSKGIAPVIAAILLILITVSLAFMFYAWGLDVTQLFETTSEEVTQRRISEAKSSFFITVASGREIGIKNNGEISLDTSDFSVYLNDSLVETESDVNNLGPGNATTLNITSSFSSGNYSIKVSGPYGKYDRTFDDLAAAPVLDTQPPLYFDSSVSSTQAGTDVEFRVRWTDNFGLSGYVFQFCNGTWDGSECNFPTKEDDFESYSNGDTTSSMPGWYSGSDCGTCQVSNNQANSGSNSFYEDVSSTDDYQDVLRYDFNKELVWLNVSGYYWETTSNHDGNFWVKACDGTNLAGIGTENPQYEAVVGGTTGDDGEVYRDSCPGGVYQTWTYVEMVLNMTANEVTFYHTSSLCSHGPTSTSLGASGKKICSFGVGPDDVWYVDDVKLEGKSSTGSWQNDTWTSFPSGGTEDWSNVTKTITDEVGATVAWKVYANDTSNLWNSTPIYSFTTT